MEKQNPKSTLYRSLGARLKSHRATHGMEDASGIADQTEKFAAEFLPLEEEQKLDIAEVTLFLSKARQWVLKALKTNKNECDRALQALQRVDKALLDFGKMKDIESMDNFLKQVDVRPFPNSAFRERVGHDETLTDHIRVHVKVISALKLANFAKKKGYFIKHQVIPSPRVQIIAETSSDVDYLCSMTESVKNNCDNPVFEKSSEFILNGVVESSHGVDPNDRITFTVQDESASANVDMGEVSFLLGDCILPKRKDDLPCSLNINEPWIATFHLEKGSCEKEVSELKPELQGGGEIRIWNNNVRFLG
eukprot:g1594.t1